VDARAEVEDPPVFDDMRGWPELELSSGALQAQLAASQAAVEAIFFTADALALRYQRRHRKITILSAVFGTTAVLLAIVQLSGLFAEGWSRWGEFVAAVIALFAVGLGIVSALQQTWLLERHKAERCRLAKFRLLTDPALWSGDANAIRNRIEQFSKEVQAISGLSRRELDEWVEDDQIPLIPDAGSLAGTNPALAKLAAYYKDKRLVVQRDFFFDRWNLNVRQDKRTYLVPPAFFFLSVLFALSHFVYDIVFSDHAEAGAALSPSRASVVLIALAAALPVLGAGVRTYRTAYEFARNTIRYRAKYVALEHINATLKARSRQSINPRELFHSLWCSEQILESEHREWLRLMIEAEWFG